MATQIVRLRYRPLRFGWCVRDGNLDDIRCVLRLTHTLWGGRYNPIIPVGDHGYGAELVDLYRVDALSPAAEDPALAEFINRFQYLRWPSIDKQFFIEGVEGRGLATFLDIYSPVRRIYEEYVKEQPYSAVTTNLYSWDKSDQLADVFLAYFGEYPSKDEIGIDYPAFVEKYLNGASPNLPATDPLPLDALEAMTPSAISAFDLRRDRLPNWDYPGLYVGDASSFEDIVNFWNLRAADLELVFFDPKLDTRLKAAASIHVAKLKEQPDEPVGRPDEIGIWSREGVEVDTGEFGSGFLRVFLRDGVWNGLNLKPPLMYIEEQSALASRSESDGTPSLSFDLRPKPFFQENVYHAQKLVVGVRPFVYGEKEPTTFRYPHIPELNGFYRSQALHGITETRSGVDGLDVVMDASWDTLSVHAISRRALVSKLFEVFGIKANLSEPGRIAQRLIQQMGGVQGCRVFKIAGVRELIEMYTPFRPFTRSDGLKAIGERQFQQYEDLYIEQGQPGKLEPAQVFDFLLKQNVFRVGLSLLCPHCELSFWVHLDDVATEIRCENCGSPFNIATQLKDRNWTYRRSGLFGRDDHQQGAIPVALTLQQIDTVLNTEMIFMTSMTVDPISAAISPCESDIVIISQRGRHANVDVAVGKTYPTVDIAIGECKARGEITSDDVAKLTQLADALPTKRIVPYIIFAKTAPFTPEEIERCKAARSTRRRRVILLSDRELEPYFVYARAAKEFEMRPTVVSLEDLARGTDNIYFIPKPKKMA